MDNKHFDYKTHLIKDNDPIRFALDGAYLLDQPLLLTGVPGTGKTTFANWAIHYLNEKYEVLDFPEGEYETLSGYLVTTMETIPEQNAEILLHGYKFVLELVSDTKIETIRVFKLDGE